MLHNEINDLTQYEVNTKRLQRLERKQRPKTKAQRLKGFFIVLMAVGLLCQFLSALLASSGVFHYLSLKLNSNGFILSITSICILLLIEGSKRFTLDSFHAQRLDDEKINKITYAFIALWGCLSIGSTYYGTPYAIEYFAASPTLINVDSISTNLDKQLFKDKAVLLAELSEHNTDANTIYKAAEWKGRISSKDRKAYNKVLDKAANVKVKISDLEIKRSEGKALIINQAIKENKEIVKHHSAWCYSFGSTLALISVFLELLFFGAVWWCEGYKRLEVIEARKILEVQETDNGNRTTSNNANSVRLSGTDNTTNTHRPVIAGFTTNKESNSMRTCSNCGTDISTKRSDAKFCSTKCRGLHHKAKR